jgi:DNA-binding GntR family transcriptional regulator
MLSRLEDAGFGPLWFQEIVAARAAMPDEVETLQLSPGVPVLLVYRLTCSPDGRVLDAQERVIAADRSEQWYLFGEVPPGQG